MTASNAGTPDWRALTEQFVAELGPIHESLERTYLGPLGVKFSQRALSKLSLTKAVPVADAVCVIVLADAAGAADEARAAARVWRRLPYVGNKTLYEPVRELMCALVRRDARASPPATGEFVDVIGYGQLAGTTTEPDDNDAVDRRRAGRILHLNWEREDLKPTLPTVANICIDRSELAFMWTYGGSAQWPRDRIDAAISKCDLVLRQLGAVR